MILPPWLWRLTHSRTFWIVSACLPVVLTLLFYGIANTWGEWKLERVRKDLAKQGYALTWEDLLKTNPPRNEDLLRHEVMLRKHPIIDEKLVAMGYKREDLSLWTPQPKDGKRFSAAAVCGRPGTDEKAANAQLIRDLAMMEPTAGEIKDAVRSSKGIGREITGNPRRSIDPIVPALNWMSSFISRRAVLRAAAGDTHGAMDDLRLNCEYLEILHKQPRSMLSTVIAIGVAAVLVNHTWQVIQEPSMSAEQLREIDRWMLELDNGKATVSCYRNEIVSINELIPVDFGPITATKLQAMEWDIDWRDSKQWRPTARRWWRQIRPVGLAKLELAAALQRIDREIVHLPDGSEREAWTPEDADRIAAIHEKVPDDFEDQKPQDRVYVAAEAIIRKQLKARSGLRLTRVAIAAELYRRDHGTFPASIQVLVPRYLKNPPLDAQSGKPILLETSASGGLIITAPGVNAKTRIHWPIPAK